MLARIPSLKLVRLWAALLLATIGLQAMVPAAAGAQKHSGSAFSSSTYEVALAVSRADRAPRQTVVPQPAPMPVEQAQAMQAAAPALRVMPAPRPDSTGPPPRSVHSWLPPQRGPPRA